jgi:hypothetical protein
MEKTWIKLYVQDEDLERCRKALRMHEPDSIAGLNANGQTEMITGTVQFIERDQSPFKEYPHRVTIARANQ